MNPTQLALMALLGHLGCHVKYLDDVIDRLADATMPDTPSEVLQVLKDAMTAVGLTPYSDGWYKPEDHVYSLQRLT